ncbi:GAP family protein [Brevibacterium album]|uniref:GAP family protein n=1 Tax=Brevibacterium album TaxID=417948 RepID=UPI0004220154|nr:GAP family protein [Brevibacterium album]
MTTGPLTATAMSAAPTALLDGGTAVPALWGVLAALALLDSTSFGTLLIPVWFLMAPGRLRAGRVLVYLAVVAGAYALIGLLVLAGLLIVGESLLDCLEAAQQSAPFLLGQAALAAGLIWFSCRLDPFTARGRERKRAREAARGTPDRLARFRSRAVGEGAEAGLGPLLGLALAAVGLEITTLLPYLAGLGMIAAADPGLPTAPAMGLFYCLVMILPALLLLVIRVTAERFAAGPLRRLEAFLSRHANGTIALILFLLGLWLGAGALFGLADLAGL